MGYDYALVHLKYTIPPAIALTFLYRSFLNRVDVFKICFLLCIAVGATIPWDSYLIRRNIWTYPPSAIVGPTLYGIPAEELFFFFIQTYNTSLLYLILSKPLFLPKYLSPTAKSAGQWIGQVVLVALIATGGVLIWRENSGLYLGLILAWAGPFALLLWSLSSHFFVRLPYTSTLAPIVLPTLYLWIVDTLSLRRGTWRIETGTKLDIQLWEGLEIEEAIFFLATNILIVFGSVTCDHALTVLLSFPKRFPELPQLPTPILVARALLLSPLDYDGARIIGIQQAVKRLQKKSRSFYLASATFTGRLRIDLILLYAFCRVADDLVDDATGETEAREWIDKLRRFLDLSYSSLDQKQDVQRQDVQSYITDNFPESTQSAFRQLPTHLLSPGPLYDLLKGFENDLEFQYSNASRTAKHFPIGTEQDLEVYGARVAGTVAELCLELVFHHSYTKTSLDHRQRLIHAGGQMGIALQYVNIARDIRTDAAIGRVYLPTSWLDGAGVTPQDVLEKPNLLEVEMLRRKLLDKAFAIYQEAKPAMAQIPTEARAPMRVAVESYMEIGRVLREGRYRMKAGRATVPKLRRLRVAWRALHEA